MKITTMLLTAAFSLGAGVVLADTKGMQSMADDSIKPFMVPMDAMMSAIPMMSTGKPDADFLLMMIPHHQSAIDMAQVELKLGKDHPTQVMAQQIIDAQKTEIATMRLMLQAMGVTPPPAN